MPQVKALERNLAFFGKHTVPYSCVSLTFGWGIKIWISNRKFFHSNWFNKSLKKKIQFDSTSDPNFDSWSKSTLLLHMNRVLNLNFNQTFIILVYLSGTSNIEYYPSGEVIGFDSYLEGQNNDQYLDLQVSINPADHGRWTFNNDDTYVICFKCNLAHYFFCLHCLNIFFSRSSSLQVYLCLQGGFWTNS